MKNQDSSRRPPYFTDNFEQLVKLKKGFGNFFVTGYSSRQADLEKNINRNRGIYQCHFHLTIFFLDDADKLTFSVVSEATSQLTDLEPPSEAVKIHCFRPAATDVITSSCFGGAAPLWPHRSSSLSPPPCNGGISGGHRFVWRGRGQNAQTAATSAGRKLAAEKSVPGTGGAAEMERIKSSPPATAADTQEKHCKAFTSCFK
jgi:hypothetical protein